MIKAVQITVPSDGSVVVVAGQYSDTYLGDDLAVRNTGTVKVLLGGADHNCVLPLLSNSSDPDGGEFIGLTVVPADQLTVKVKTPGTAGQITVMQTK